MDCLLNVEKDPTAGAQVRDSRAAEQPQTQVHPTGDESDSGDGEDGSDICSISRRVGDCASASPDIHSYLRLTRQRSGTRVYTPPRDVV